MLLNFTDFAFYSLAAFGMLTYSTNSSFFHLTSEKSIGCPQELQHFIDCIRDESQPVFSAQNGRDVMEAVYAVYESARTGKKVELPFTSDAELPISLWKAIHSS